MSYATFPDLANCRCIVTGASKGIGAAVAVSFGFQRARVLVHFHSDRDGAEAVGETIRALGGDAVLHGCDLADKGTGAASLVNAAIAAFGGIDIVVNNAGGFDHRTSLVEGDEAAFDQIINANLRSTVSVCRAALPYLASAQDGAIVNTASIGSRTGGAAGAVLYNTAKGGVSTFTRGLAREVAPLSVRVNAVAPGIIATELQSRTTTEVMTERTLSAIPLGRIGTPRDCAHAYLFLASHLASAYVTGQVIEVNGGQLMP